MIEKSPPVCGQVCQRRPQNISQLPKQKCDCNRAPLPKLRFACCKKSFKISNIKDPRIKWMAYEGEGEAKTKV